MIHYAAVDEYFAAQPPAIQPALHQLRRAIKAVVPGAEEVIRYCMPAFRQKGIVVWYAATKKQYALYPKTNVIKAFKRNWHRIVLPKELSVFTSMSRFLLLSYRILFAFVQPKTRNWLPPKKAQNKPL